VSSADGGGGDDTFDVANGIVIAQLDGGAGSDVLKLLGAGAATYTLTGPNAGTLNGNVPFSNVENLIGTAAADTFNLLFDLDGTASGEDGDDIFNLGADVTAALAGGA